MTDLIYFDDCYVKEFEAKVLEVKGDAVVLDRTAFYPEGGGQPCDKGEINSSEVTKVTKREGKTLHFLDGALSDEGDKVKCRINWDRRYEHMKYHTAQHLLSAVILDEYKGKTTGNQLYEDRARIDFDVDVSEDINEIERKINQLIRDERDVRIYSISREKAEQTLDPKRARLDLIPNAISELRIVEVEDVDKTACGGTHVSNTGELGEFEIINTESKGKGKKRIEFILK